MGIVKRIRTRRYLFKIKKYIKLKFKRRKLNSNIIRRIRRRIIRHIKLIR